MIGLVNYIIIFSIILIVKNFFSLAFVGQKIFAFHFLAVAIIILILINVINKFEYITEVILLLFLLELIAVLFLFFSQKNADLAGK